MPATTRMTELLDIEFPIFAFSHCRDVVAAVTRAGGFGVLGALAYTPEELEVELSWIDDHCDGKPYGVDLVMPDNYVGKGGGAAASEAALRAMIPAEHTAFVDRVLDEAGIPELPARLRASGVPAPPGSTSTCSRPATSTSPCATRPACSSTPSARRRRTSSTRAHDHGILVAALVGARRHAERQVERGVDIIVAQGGEAGGHTGDVATMVLVPEVRDAVGPGRPGPRRRRHRHGPADGRRAGARRRRRVDRLDLAHRRRVEHRAARRREPARRPVRATRCDPGR